MEQISLRFIEEVKRACESLHTKYSVEMLRSDHWLPRLVREARELEAEIASGALAGGEWHEAAEKELAPYLNHCTCAAPNDNHRQEFAAILGICKKYGITIPRDDLLRYLHGGWVNCLQACTLLTWKK